MVLLQSNQVKDMQEQIVNLLKEQFGVEVDTQAVRTVADQLNTSYATASKYLQTYKVGRGKWNLEATVKELEETYNAPAAEGVDTVQTIASVQQNLIPVKDDTFVNFGNFSDIKKVVSSGLFYPSFITGLSGNGKTFGVEQACAQLGRELIRVNITIETDEDDLIGGFRLVNGETVWHNGPVVEAMERGAILLLDEIDLASNKIMCLQSILEGKGVFLKKIGKHIVLRQDSMCLLLLTPKVRVLMMDVSLALMCSMRHFLRGSLSPLNRSILPLL